MARAHETQAKISRQVEPKGEIIMYKANDTVKLDVRLENETVWLTQAQMAELFERERTVITKHINNVFAEAELTEESNVQNLHFAFSDKPVKVYSLDVIISVGYRVKSVRGTQFRQWANKVLKEYMMRGYAINQRVSALEDKVDRRLAEHDSRITKTEEKIDFFVRTSLPPVEGIFYDGQIYDAYVFVSGLIKKAKKRVVLIDNYIDESVLVTLDKRKKNVVATVYTAKINAQLKLDIAKHNSQYAPIDVKIFKSSHDRFLIIDDAVYHIGASLKDLGRKWMAFALLKDTSADDLIARVK